MLQRSLTVALGIASALSQFALLQLVSLSATAQDQKSPEIQVFSGTSVRQATRIGYWNPKAGMVGMLSVHYANPVWKKEHDAMLAAAKKGKMALQLRLGAGLWTTLNTDLDLTIGTTRLSPGQYYLGLQVSGKGDYGLLIANAVDVRARRLTAASTDRLKKFVIARMEHTVAKTPAAKLEINLIRGKVVGHSTLQVKWGGHVLSTAVAAAMSPSVRKATPVEIDTARADIASLDQAVTLFAMRRGKLPSMADLVRPDANGQAYLRGHSGAVPVDPWGKPYLVQASDGRLKFEVISLGPDGLKGTGDDLSSKSK